MSRFLLTRSSSEALLLIAVGLALVIGQPVLGQSDAQEWTGFRGPNGDGSVALSEQATGLKLSWKQPIGSAYSGISVSAGLVVTAAARDGEDWLIALDANTGRERWALSLGPAYLGHGGSLDGVIASPAIADGSVYIFSNRGQFVAVDLRSGQQQWRRDLSAEETESPYYGFASSPLVVGDLVVVQLGQDAGAVIAMERSTGEIAWRSYADGANAQSPKLITVNGRKQVVVASNSWVSGLDPQEGSLLWRWGYSARSAMVLSTSPLPLPEGRLFFTPSDDKGVMLQIPTTSQPSSPESAPEASVLWEARAMTNTYSPPTRVGDALVGYTSRFLSAFSVEDGSRLWRSRAPGDGFLIALGDQLAVVTKAGSLHLANLNEEGWDPVASEDLFEALVWTPPTYSEGSLFVRSMTEIARVDVQFTASEEERPVVTEALTAETPDRIRSAAAAGSMPSALRALVEPAESGDQRSQEERITAFLEANPTPVIDGDRALFLWRGAASDVGIAADFLGMRVEAPFERVDGTDLWWYQVELDPRMQYTYLLYVDYQPTVDPRNPKRERNSVWGTNANWVRSRQGLPETSYFAMPEWSGEAVHLRADAPAPVAPGKVIEVELEISPEAGTEYQERFEQALNVWVPPGYDTSSERYPTVYMHEWAGARDPAVGRWIDTLDRVSGKEFAPVIVVFLNRPIPRGASMKPLVDAVDSQLRTRREPSARANVSMGFIAPEAIALTGREPELFLKFGVQSFLGFEEEIEAAVDAFTASPSETGSAQSPITGYFEWGELDIRSPSEGWDMRAFAQRTFDGLRSKGVELRGGPIVDTTDWKSWRHRTHVLLGALFPVE